MSYPIAYRFWYFANDNGGQSRRAVQDKAPDYPGLARLPIMLAVMRNDIDRDDFIDELP